MRSAREMNRHHCGTSATHHPGSYRRIKAAGEQRHAFSRSAYRQASYTTLRLRIDKYIALVKEHVHCRLWIVYIHIFCGESFTKRCSHFTIELNGMQMVAGICSLGLHLEGREMLHLSKSRNGSRKILSRILSGAKRQRYPCHSRNPSDEWHGLLRRLWTGEGGQKVTGNPRDRSYGQPS